MASRFLRFNALTETRQRDRGVETLLSRAGAVEPAVDWRARAFQLLSPSQPVPSAGGSAYRGAAPAEAAHCAAVATPVHLLAELTQVRLPVGGLVAVTPAEAHALAEDFNRIWSDAGLRIATREHHMAMRFEQDVEVETTDPEQIQGRHLDEYLPRGRDAGAVRRLQSEIEMWLYTHPVNAARRLRREAPISGLWLWGFGAAPAAVAPGSICAAGDDPVFSAFETPADAVPDLLITRHSPGDEAWQLLAAPWLERTVKDLRAGAIEALFLSAGSQLFALRRGHLLRFWRRARAWWHYLE